jgi:hypothetical protein
LLAVETAVFTGFGFKCPLRALAVKYGARTGHVFDTFLPERVTRYTFRLFGTVMVVGVLLLAARWFGIPQERSHSAKLGVGARSEAISNDR